MGFKSREYLRSQLVELFSQQEEVFQISLFGAEVEGGIDEYSDIDLIVCSSDMAETYRKYLGIFQAISPVIGRFQVLVTD